MNFGLDRMNAVGEFRPTIESVDYAGKVADGKGKHILSNLVEYYDEKENTGNAIWVS